MPPHATQYCSSYFSWYLKTRVTSAAGAATSYHERVAARVDAVPDLLAVLRRRAKAGCENVVLFD